MFNKGACACFLVVLELFLDFLEIPLFLDNVTITTTPSLVGSWVTGGPSHFVIPLCYNTGSSCGSLALPVLGVRSQVMKCSVVSQTSIISH